MAWAKNGTPSTLTSAGDIMTISDMTANKFNVYLSHALDNGSNIGSTLTFDGVGGTSYAQRTSAGGATDVTLTSRANLLLREAIKDNFEVGYFINITNEEKLVINFDISNTATGAATAPSRRELVGKFVQNAQVTQITNTNDQAGSFDTSSNLSALGSDLTPAAAIPFAENAQVGSRAEITDTRKMYHYNATDDVTTDGSYTVLKYTSDGTFTPTSAFNVEYLVIAGGGSGGTDSGGYGAGGGGAGGYRTNFGGTGHGVTAQSYSITVGSGGNAITTNPAQGNQGGDSIFDTITSSGGGGGGKGSGSSLAGSSGGSGGGGGDDKTGGTGNTPSTTPSQGFRGGNTGYGDNGAGGGGSGAVGGGTSVNQQGGVGGSGTSSSITGSAVIRAGGGGGSGGNTGTGGSGGGGNAGFGGNGSAGTVNTGSGGGAGPSGNSSGAGGSGIVILRFLTSGNTYTTSLALGSWTEEGT